MVEGRSRWARYQVGLQHTAGDLEDSHSPGLCLLVLPFAEAKSYLNNSSELESSGDIPETVADCFMTTVLLRMVDAIGIPDLVVEQLQVDVDLVLVESTLGDSFDLHRASQDHSPWLRLRTDLKAMR